ncbi:MAG: hypothetical protein ACPGC5_08180, partial [Flavobacteriaceae bacterium]
MNFSQFFISNIELIFETDGSQLLQELLNYPVESTPNGYAIPKFSRLISDRNKGPFEVRKAQSYPNRFAGYEADFSTQNASKYGIRLSNPAHKPHSIDPE